MAGLNVTLFGGFEARLESGAPLRLPTKKAQALMAYLGVRPGQSHARDKLASLLWGEKADDQARGGLRQAVAALRRAFVEVDPPPLRIDGRTLALDPAAVEIDVATFERRIAEGTPKALEESAELYRGDLLLGFTLDEPLFEEWLVAERERLREMALDGLARLLAHQSRSAATERGIQTAMRLLALDPLQESVHRALMRLYGRQGRRGAALKQYQICVAVFRRELGTEPEAETRRLYQELLRRSTESAPTGETPGEPRGEGAPALPPASTDLPAAETPLFGRETELGRLRARLGEAATGQGRVATIAGEAGIGKTRLVGALAAEALARGCRVLVGRCHESDTILPFGPWVDALRKGRVGTDEGTLVGLAPPLRAELTRLLPEASAPGLRSPSDSALGLFESVAGIVEALACRQPLVLVLEDLHWADEMSLRLLAFVTRRLQAWPVLLVVTMRDDELADASMARRTLDELSRPPSTTAVSLAALARTDAAALVRALARTGSEASAVAEVESRVWTMSEGNPFVIVEAMRALEPGAPALPASVRDLVGRRLDRLGARAQQLAAVAAAIGRRCDFTLLHAASGLDEGAVAEAVEEMVRLRVLQAVGDGLEFTHDRVRDVAYGRLLLPRRRLLHRAVAEAIEATDALGEEIEQIAYHALHGELWEKAVRYLREAGERAAARGAIPEARAWIEQALDVLATLPESRATLEAACDLRFALRAALTQLGELRRSLALLREAETLAERLGDDARRGRAYAYMTNLHTRLDELDAARTSGTRALEIADRLGDARLRILATGFLGQAYYYRGEYARAIELALANIGAQSPEQLREFFAGSQQIVTVVNERLRLISSLAGLGRFSEAAEHEAQVIAFAEAAHHTYAMSLAYHAAGVLHLSRGDWATAHARLERQVALLRSGGLAGDLPLAIAYDARALAYLGEVAAAMDLAREGEQLIELQAQREGAANGFVYWSLARACLLAGSVDDAERLADRISRSPSARSDVLPFVQHLRGDIATHEERFDPARGEACFHDALAVAESREMRPLIALCHLGLGRIAARLGKRETALARIAAAAGMFRAMEMPYWVAQAEKESARLD